ncbi:MAG: inositol monophosphatase family protein [Acidimicrobiales bacterium]
MGPHQPAEDRDLDLALRLADRADILGLRYFTGAELDHDTKPDGTPVSAADREIERVLRAMVAEERPGDGFLGEEVGESGHADRRWIVDGIDGTVLFVAGLTGWATQIALEIRGEVVIGVSTSAPLERRWWARRGGGAWRAATGEGRLGAPERMAVSHRTSLTGGRVTAIPPIDALSADQRVSVDRLTATSDYVPPHEHGAVLVADGRADVCVQASGGPWDFAALAVIVEEAGGHFSNLAGQWVIDDGGPVVFSNGHVHDQALRALTSSRA